MADIAVDTPFVELLISGWEPVAAKEAAVDSADVSMDVSDCRPVRTFATLEPFTRFWEPLMRPEANSSVKAVVAEVRLAAAAQAVAAVADALVAVASAVADKPTCYEIESDNNLGNHLYKV